MSCTLSDGSTNAFWVNPKGQRIDSSPQRYAIWSMNAFTHRNSFAILFYMLAFPFFTLLWIGINTKDVPHFSTFSFSSRIRVEISYGVDLFLNRITTHDEGLYSCVAPKGSRASFNLTVIRKPFFYLLEFHNFLSSSAHLTSIASLLRFDSSVHTFSYQEVWEQEKRVAFKHFSVFKLTYIIVLQNVMYSLHIPSPTQTWAWIYYISTNKKYSGFKDRICYLLNSREKENEKCYFLGNFAHHSFLIRSGTSMIEHKLHYPLLWEEQIYEWYRKMENWKESRCIIHENTYLSHHCTVYIPPLKRTNK